MAHLNKEKLRIPLRGASLINLDPGAIQGSRQ